MRQTNIEIVGGLGLGGGLRTLYRQLSVLNTEERALKLSDLWIEQETRRETLIARNRITKRLVNIPLECLTPSLRRHSGVDCLDVYVKYDFLVTNTFSDIGEFLDDKKLEQRFEKNKKLWKEYLRRRQGSVFIARKFDLSAPGTRLVSFYSSVSLVPGEFWLIRNLDLEFGKILCLWFNCTPNLVQMFLNRTETRGAWMKSDISTLKETYVIDPMALEKKEKRELLDLFSDLIHFPFPSIVEQLRVTHPARKKIDQTILKIIGFSEDETEEVLNYLYPALHSEIIKLKTLMEG